MVDHKKCKGDINLFFYKKFYFHNEKSVNSVKTEC